MNTKFKSTTSIWHGHFSHFWSF